MAELHRVTGAKNKAYGLFRERELADSLRYVRQGGVTTAFALLAVCGGELAKYPFADGGIVCSATTAIWR